MLLFLAACGRLYGALLVLYPEAFRRRYEAEMQRDFSELMREVLEEGGAKELVRVWAQAHTDLVLTALKERGTTSASRYAAYLSVDPRIAKRAAARAMVVTVVLAFAVFSAGLQQTPTYESSARLWVDHSGASSKGVEGMGATIPLMTHAIDSRPIAEETIRRLEELPSEGEMILENLTARQIEGTQFIELTYEDSDPQRAQLIASTVAEIASERIPETIPSGASNVTVTVWKKAALPESPASPHPLRNGLLTLVIGLVLSAVLTLPQLRPLAARVAGTLGERSSHQRVGQAGVLSRRHSDYSIVERLKEKKLLRALGRRGKLTAVGAALATSLSVEESRRILEELAFAGHLQVTVEHGRLLYSFWGSTEHEDVAAGGSCAARGYACESRGVW
jgi:capsular polysaccharide biosynthesis protein